MFNKMFFNAHMFITTVFIMVNVFEYDFNLIIYSIYEFPRCTYNSLHGSGLESALRSFSSKPYYSAN